MITKLADLALNNKTVFLRVDFNVPIKDGQITEPHRIDSVLPTIRLRSVEADFGADEENAIAIMRHGFLLSSRLDTSLRAYERIDMNPSFKLFIV